MTGQELSAGPGAVAIQGTGNNVSRSVGGISLVLEHKLSARSAMTDECSGANWAHGNIAILSAFYNLRIIPRDT